MYILKGKAKVIIKRKKEKVSAKYLVVPHSHLTHALGLRCIGMQLISATGNKIRDVVTRKKQIGRNDNSKVYERS